MIKRMIHRITLKSDVSNVGDDDPSYSNYMINVPCDIKDVTGGERYLGKQLQAETTVAIVTRFNENFTSDMIAVNEHTDVTYHLGRVLDVDGRRRYLLMMATEVMN